jgi:hypothetical protein
MNPTERAIEKLRNPKPGSKIWEAREFGIDLTLLMNRLRETPEERSRNLESFLTDFARSGADIRKT